GLTAVVAEVVEFPLRIKCRRRCVTRTTELEGGCRQPAVLVERGVPGNLEILQMVARWRDGLIEGVSEAHSVERLLLHAIKAGGRSQFRGFEQGGQDIDEMGKLLPLA